MSSESGKRRPYRMQERAQRQEETRRRIVAATAELHAEVGPARTTIAEVARRAGVQRPTVYNNFPTDGALFAACQAHVLAEHPPPDPAPALRLPDPADRIERVLAGVYAWYLATAPMTSNVQRDRRLLPELDALLSATSDARFDDLADALTGGLVTAGRAPRVRALVRLALEVTTWERLAADGLGATPRPRGSCGKPSRERPASRRPAGSSPAVRVSVLAPMCSAAHRASVRPVGGTRPPGDPGEPMQRIVSRRAGRGLVAAAACATAIIVPSSPTASAQTTSSASSLQDLCLPFYAPGPQPNPLTVYGICMAVTGLLPAGS